MNFGHVPSLAHCAPRDMLRAVPPQPTGASNDPCWDDARRALRHSVPELLEAEAQAWRTNLTQALERYYNEESEAWFSQQPATVLERVEKAFQLNFAPRPPRTQAIREQTSMPCRFKARSLTPGDGLTFFCREGWLARRAGSNPRGICACILNFWEREGPRATVTCPVGSSSVTASTVSCTRWAAMTSLTLKKRCFKGATVPSTHSTAHQMPRLSSSLTATTSTTLASAHQHRAVPS
mmetsp:Transcript_60570/g.135022  ORF Transcript_60570/g.135022 Transcript_60570/m.135022 type:complete len:237 (-) Transcript_60570:397-1107(-)